MLNIYLLFHKCGNNYVLNVHRIDTETAFIKSVVPNEAANIVEHDKGETIVNVRCRNFGYGDIKESCLLNVESARFIIFTRNPAGFILSAAKYHYRGCEEWAVKKHQKDLGGKTLTQALRDSTSLDEQHIIIMKHFDWLYKKQVSLLKLVNDQRFLRVRCENLFTTTEENYFSNLANFFRLSKEPSFLNALKAASPAFKKKLPNHSTGSFKVENPYDALGDEAKSYFDAHWLEYARTLDYDCGEKETGDRP
ncbi:MAG: hypothetical protein EOM20_20380 [Spartobacteria bacterium]|nr:hypothetical protein [Spartobacteria bacterium]